MLRFVLFGLGFFGLLAVPAFLYLQTEAASLDVQNRIVLDLRELKQLDAEWNTNILKSRIGINNDYDPVTAPLRHMLNLEQRLGRARVAGQGSALEAALYRLRAIFTEKEELVEQFKSQNAVLRNSLHYFPTAVEELRILLKQAATDAPRQAASLGALDARANKLLTDILRFNLIPDAELGTKIVASIADIEQDRSGYPAALDHALLLLTKHAQTILQQRMVEDSLMARIAIAPTVQGMDNLSNAFDGEFQNMLNEKQRYRSYLFGYTGFLLLLLAYVAWHLTRSYRMNAQFNKQLQAANETLEQRVAQRTAELEEQSARLAELATHDALTGLINRGQLMTRLNHALQRAQRRKRVVVVMFIDLDGFKAVNDTYGHAAGDLLLQEVAACLLRSIRLEDSIARFGGDEFVILLDEIETIEGVVRVAEAVQRAVGAITLIDGHAVAISASIGIGIAHSVQGTAHEADLLLSQADQAMYRAKQHGKGCFRFSDSAGWTPQAAQADPVPRRE